MENLIAINKLLYQRIEILEWKLKDIQLKVIRAGRADILDMDSLPEEVKLEAVEEDGSIIRYFKTPSEAVQLRAVKNYGWAIEHIKNPSEDVKFESVKQNVAYIEYIKNPSEAIQLYCVKKIGSLIQYIKNPSEAVQLEAVKQNRFAFQYIKNPTEEVQFEYFKQTTHMKNKEFDYPVPVAGQTYFYFDDGKVNEDRREEFTVTDVIPLNEIDKQTLKHWISEAKEYNWLFEDFTDFFVKGFLKGDSKELIFVRGKRGWYSFGNYMWDGRLDVDGSLNASIAGS